MRYIKLILCTLVFTIILTGCDNLTAEPPTQITDVCVLLGDFSNAKDADLSAISECVDPTVNSKVNFTIYALDGAPEDIVLTSEYNNGNRTSPDVMRDHYGKFVHNDLIPKINNAVPNQEEIDILNGLYMAEKHLSKSKADCKKLLIFSTGIPTSGYINFSNSSNIINYNDDELDSLMQEFKAKNLLPNLTGIEVYWFNICETVEPQITPNRANAVKIENFWKNVFANCGVDEKNISFNYSILDSKNSSETDKYPFVTPVMFEDEEIIWCFTDETVQFNPGESTFLNEELVYKTLKPYAEKICDTTSKKFILVGSTATFGDKDECLKLSLERAEEVKKVLCKYGVSPNRLLTFGIGQNEVGNNLTNRVVDVENGSFVEELGKLNRKVMVVDASTALGKQLLQELEN